MHAERTAITMLQYLIDQTTPEGSLESNVIRSQPGVNPTCTISKKVSAQQVERSLNHLPLLQYLKMLVKKLHMNSS